MAHSSTNEVAPLVSDAIRECGLTVNAAAHLSGIPCTTLRRRLAGSPFTVDELSRIGRILNLSASQLLAAAEQRVAP